MSLKDLAHWAEIIGSLAVVVTLIFLAREVHQNTAALERDAALRRAQTLNSPFLTNSRLPEIAAKIKAVDGTIALVQAYMDRYDLTHEESDIWARYLGLLWSELEADYALHGESDALEKRIGLLLQFPDNQLLWDQGNPQVSDEEFRAYVERIRRNR